MSVAVLQPTQSPAPSRPAVRPITGPAALIVDHATKRFRVDRRKPPVLAVDDFSVRIERGEIYGLLGANGSGKSTVIRLVSGLLTLDERRVEVFGHDLVREEMAVKRLINRVSVDAALFKKLSPAENLSFAARLYGLDTRAAHRKAIEIMARLGIGETRMGRPLEQMSRGMQQKVAIARAILTSPALLLLDEPTTGLDPRSKLDVQTFIEELQADHDATILLTTHDIAEADRLCGRIGILSGGRLTAEEIVELAARCRLRRQHGAEDVPRRRPLTPAGLPTAAAGHRRNTDRPALTGWPQRPILSAMGGIRVVHGGRQLVLIVVLMSAACSGATPPTGSSSSTSDLLRETEMAGFILTSPSFSEGGQIPVKYTCDGENLSPALAWEGAPQGTASFALIVDDPDARGFIHWVVFDIRAGSSGSLPEGVRSADTPPQGRSDFGQRGYGGPCPPSGTHRYRFTLWALSARLNLSGTPSAAEVRTAAANLTLAQATLTATYTRQR